MTTELPDDECDLTPEELAELAEENNHEISQEEAETVLDRIYRYTKMPPLDIATCACSYGRWSYFDQKGRLIASLGYGDFGYEFSLHFGLELYDADH